ncbi:hypothetical protein CGLO_18180 [Colletotrichum gloeosporioides Cg-14]|uniref:Uncharacterized protein n=1 Tax=Colletotrichum gloeosporioides (strain Cg-14) TaxID=1237896 RepID=T0JS04_COLGC|nr:hypothetical protein CGLO_18180 [Colletotrichum gloeosporioides Cg-14]
MRVSHPINYE